MTTQRYAPPFSTNYLARLDTTKIATWTSDEAGAWLAYVKARDVIRKWYRTRSIPQAKKSEIASLAEDVVAKLTDPETGEFWNWAALADPFPISSGVLIQLRDALRMARRDIVTARAK